MVDFTADFTLEPQPEMTADFNIEVTNLDHNMLWNRDLANQHPMTAITGLETALNGKQNTLTSDNAGEGISIDVVEGVVKISSTLPAAVWGFIQGTLSDQTDLQDALDQLSSSIDSNHQEISNIGQTIGTYGDIVTHYVSEFATAAQGNLADTALQTGDNISLLNNNAGYITNSALNGYATQAWVNNKGYITGITSTDVTTALGYTPYSDANPNGYQTSSDVASAVSGEATLRQNADTNLQNQIDAITAASDVTDIVGTYAELQAYDTTTLPNNSIIKVLQDESRDDETTYYRWVITNNVGAWVLIGEEGPYYTKSQADSAFVPQTRTVNDKALSADITLTASDVGALPSSTTIGNGTLTIQKNGTTVQTFTANQTGNVTANISVPTDTGDLTNNAGYITSSALSPYVLSSSLATVATSGDYDDLTNKPTIPAAQVNSDWNAASGVAQILNKPTLATVATSGSYTDLSNTPAVTTATGITYVGASSSASTSGTALGYSAKTTGVFGIAIGRGATSKADYAYQIGYGANNTTSYSLAIGFGTAKTYILLDGNTGLIPDDRISTNIARTSAIPTDTGDLTNNAGFITSSALSGYATETWVENKGYITGITSSDVTTALGYTPYSDANPSGYQANVIETVKVNGTALTVTSKAVDITVPTNYVTTNTAQDISAKKTFLGEKAILFKQTATTDKLGFTLYNTSGSELGALEYRPNTISGGALINLNTSQSGTSWLGFRYWSNINIIAPKPANGNYYIPVNFTNGTNTVTASNNGTVNISSLLPSYSQGTGIIISSNTISADIATSVSASSDNTKSVGAKLFYDTCGDIETLINAL